ncbi:MAG: hypothetical protein KDA41_06330, partial [Planctomycetales bacterium]|nr:hypothetical protein [Planctomycetales bacterium]
MTALRFLAALSLLCLASTAQAAWPHGGHYAPVGAGYYSAGYSGYPLAVTGWQTTGVVPYYGANLVTVDGLGVTTVGVPTVGVASWGVPGYVWGYAPNHNASLGETLLILKQLNLLGGKDNSNEIADIN